MEQITLKVIATRNNPNFPDDKSILEYLVKYGLVPKFQEKLSWVFPYSSEKEQFDEYVLHEMATVFNPPKEYVEQFEHTPKDKLATAWAIVDTARSAIILIANCDAEDEGVIATWFRKALVEASGYKDEDITVVFSDTGEGNTPLTPDLVGAIRSALPCASRQMMAINRYLEHHLGCRLVGPLSESRSTLNLCTVVGHFEVFHKKFELSVANDAGTMRFHLHDTGSGKKFAVNDPDKIEVDIADYLYFSYGGIVCKAFASFPTLTLRDYDVNLKENRIVYYYTVNVYTIVITLNASGVKYAWYMEVQENGHEVGHTDECRFDTNLHELAKQVFNIIHEHTRGKVKTAINDLLGGNASFADEKPIKDTKQHVVTYAGTYLGVNASFSINSNFLDRPEVTVSLYSKAGGLIGNVTIGKNPPGNSAWKLAELVADVKSEPVIDKPEPDSASPCPVNPVDRVAALEGKVAELLEEIREVKELLRHPATTVDVQGGQG